LRNQEVALRVRLQARGGAVMAEQYFLNLARRFGAIHAQLPLSENDESLAAHAAVGLGASVDALAKYLHLVPSFRPDLFPPRR
jgi:hypothetical protein